MRTSKDIRNSFLDFFEQRGHNVVTSAPLVPRNDPTLMFANAGMVPFKDIFTGKEQKLYPRACSSQKCIRISGKHNDLENVGVTARHHTFFEMLGNFSFGDYFKEQAITYAWEFITRTLNLPKDKLVVTVFGGENGVPADEEAEKLWAKISGLPKERIVRLGMKDNFWQMGDVGPCGPCSEIHYYQGDDEPKLALFGQEPSMDGRGWVELWNLVFMQFNRHADGRLEPLPAPSIDTGAGLERLCAALQGVYSNFDTDLLRPIVDQAAALSGKRYLSSQHADDVSMRVIADHARMTAFLIAEGVFPDRDGRPYVLRRVMRRAIRHGHRLGIEKLFFHECALSVVKLMGDVYPELKERAALIEEITRQEEERFRRTLRRGLELIESQQDWEKSSAGERVLPASFSFLLYDTYGFPVDLQEVIGREQGFLLDTAGFEKEMAKAKQKSAGSKVGEEAVEDVYRALRSRLEPVEFVGYEHETFASTVLALLADGKEVKSINANETAEVIVQATPFYSEAGGQVGDRGQIVAAGSVFTVQDTQRPVDGLVVHRGVMSQGTLSVGAKVELGVDAEARTATRRNHSATHLLHFALRQVLGPQAMQKGSRVASDRLRFDYSSSRPLESKEIEHIEDLVNERILRNEPIATQVLAYDEAKKRGAIGIFEEKYGDTVRMLQITSDSLELCGGTHANRTGDIGYFKILSDSGIAAGVRRIEALTGAHAYQHARELEKELIKAATLLKGPWQQTSEKIDKLLQDQKELQREMDRVTHKLLSAKSQDIAHNAQKRGQVYVLATVVDVGDPALLREMAEQIRDKNEPAVVMLGTKTKDGKASLVCAVSKSLTQTFQAGTLIRNAAQLVGGGGGGRPDFAQAGGSEPEKLQEAVESVFSAFK